ncbi:Prosaposin [Nymphaea thermarum]|nr:Prosaposin [Nymphaea thermarum]
MDVVDVSYKAMPQFNYLNLEIIASEDVQNEKVCTLCEQFASQAVYYLGDNQTQTEIITKLHVACKQLHSFSHQCVALVDYYAPLILMEVGMVNPEEFCAKVNLCERDFLVSQQKQDGCEICHKAIAEILLKLKDPDTQLEVIEILLKGCEKVEDHVKECKRLVLEYGPLLMTNAEKFLETRDVCRTIRACKAPGSVFTNLPSIIKSALTAGALNEVM